MAASRVRCRRVPSGILPSSAYNGAAAWRSFSSHARLAAAARPSPQSAAHPLSTAAALSSSPLTDTFGRRHSYLRLSVTERCNLRCSYCMPAEGVELSAREQLLSASELQRVMALFVSEGVTKLRFTGGEPLVRPDLAALVQAASELKPAGVHTVAITTNGLVLSRKLDSLLQAGLTHINISLDTLHAGKFELISRRKGHERVVAAIEQCVAAGDQLRAVKVNCVVQKGVNEDELVDFVELTRDRDIEVRFIEYMPFGGNQFAHARFMAYSDMLADIRKVHPSLQPMAREAGGVSKTYQVPGWKGRVGFISSMSEHFCGECNRLRITADGQLKVCLFDNKEVSLRDIMRSGCSDEELRALVGLAVRGKKASHAGMNVLASAEHKNRPMIKIGG